METRMTKKRMKKSRKTRGEGGNILSTPFANESVPSRLFVETRLPLGRWLILRPRASLRQLLEEVEEEEEKEEEEEERECLRCWKMMDAL